MKKNKEKSKEFKRNRDIFKKSFKKGLTIQISCNIIADVANNSIIQEERQCQHLWQTRKTLSASGML